MSTAKKALVLALFAVVAVGTAAYAVAPSDYGLKEGDVISAAGSDDPDVYIVNELGYKRLFLNPAIFGFYGHLGGFSAVKTVTPATRDAFKTSGLFRLDGDEKVYGVESTGEDTAVLHWVNTTGAQAVIDDPDFFKKVFVINQNEFNWYQKGSDYTSVSQVPVYARGGSVPSGNAGSLSVGLASDNPAGGTVVAEQAIASLAHYKLTNTSSSDVKVTKVVLKRLGVSGDATLSNVYLFDGMMNKRLTDAGSVSSGLVSFNDAAGIITVPAYGYVVLAVRSDIAAGTAGQTVGVELTMLNESAVSSMGNIFSVATNPGLTTFQLQHATIAPSGDLSPNPPAMDLEVMRFNVAVGSKDVWFKRLAVREIGSIVYSDIKNFRLYADGTLVATVANLDSNGYANFVPASPVKMMSGTRTMKVLADVVGGSTRTFLFSVKGAYDVEVVDSNYNVNIAATNTSTFPLNTTSSTVLGGSVTVTKASDSPSGDVIKGSNDVVLAKYTLKGYGEAVKIETLTVGISYQGTTVGKLRNGRLLMNGVQVGNTADILTTGASSNSFNVNQTLLPDQSATLEVRADIYDADGTDNTAANDTFTVKLEAGSSNAEKKVSGGMFNVPSAEFAGNQMTVKSGTFGLSKYTPYASQNVTIPRQALKLAAFTLTGSTVEDVNLNTITATFTGANDWAVNTLTDVYVKYGTAQTSVKSTVSGTATWSVNLVLAKNQNMNVEVYANVSSFTVAGSDDTMKTDLYMSGTTANSGQSVNSGTVDGQTLTAEAGSVTSAVGGGTAVSQNLVANSSADASQFSFTATNDSYKLTEVVVKLHSTASASDAAAIQSLSLKKADGTVLGTLPLSLSSDDYIATFVLSPALDIPSNVTDGLIVNAAANLAAVGVGGSATQAKLKLTMDSFKATNSNGVLSTSATDREGNQHYVFKAVPKITAQALETTVLAAGTKELAKVKVEGQGDTIGWQEMRFTVTKTSAVTLASASYQLFEDGVDISATGTFTVTSVGVGQTAGSIVFTSAAERQVSTAGRVYSLKATVGGSLTAGNNINVSLANPSTFVAKQAATSYASTESFVWTDRSAASHALGTSDWMNDYLVKNLPTSQGLSL